MLTWKTHLMTRLPVLLVCSTVFLAAPRTALRAGPPDSPGEVQTADGEAPPHSSFSEIIQAGGKAFGKNPPVESTSRALPELNAKGTSSATARKAAIAELPLEQLTPENRHKVSSLLKSVSFYRRLPKGTFPVEPDVYNYFMAHPDTAVSIWRAMKISKLQMWQTGRNDYEADTGDGSVGTLEVLHAGTDKSLVACDGTYKSPAFTRPIEAKSLLLLETSFSRDAEGTVYVTHRADLFVSFPSQTIDVVSKIFSPLAVSMTDRTFVEVSLFLKMMSLAMTRRPDWVEQITEKMDGVADIRKDQVLELSDQVHAAARKRAAEQAGWADPDYPGSTRPGRPEGLGHIPPLSLERRSPATTPSARREFTEKPGTPRVSSADRRAVDGK
ncbi:MAG: hypothetical protein ACM3U2_14390 [Deltaproteobacteria bacterium]